MTTTIDTDANGLQVLIIKIPVSKRPSASGKSMVIASSNGNIQTSATIDGQNVIVGLNAYIKR